MNALRHRYRPYHSLGCLQPKTLSFLSNRIRCFTTITSQSFRKTRWHRFGMVLRYSRIPVLVLSVYGIGYQQGIIDTTRTPFAMQHGLLLSILKSVGVTQNTGDSVERLISNASYSDVTTEQLMVMTVGQQIVQAARRYVQEQLQEAIGKAQEEDDDMPSDMTMQQQFEYIMSRQSRYAETIQFWYSAQLRLNGETSSNAEPWTYIWVTQRKQVPNAFVTEILPRHFFITAAMNRIATTPDEWGVVLGHEISHLILAHNSQANYMELFLRTLEVLLLSLDPTEGSLSVMVVAALAALHRGLAAAYSREHERQADELGLILAARACFDTTKGIEVMHKMHQHAVSAAPKQGFGGIVTNTASISVSLWDTHPPSLERYHQLQVASQTEHPDKYAHCRTLTARFWRALGRVNDTRTNYGIEREAN